MTEHRKEPLDDGLVRRSFGVNVKGIDREARTIDVIASTSALDAHGEIIEQDWDLDRYKANPVVLWNHNACGYFETPDPEDMLPIGFSKVVGVVGGRLEATLCFVDEKAAPLAEKVWQGFLQGSIRAVSVGFRPKNIASERINDVDTYQLSGCELFEISACPMGSNPEAVRKSLRDKQHQAFAAIAEANKPTKALETQTMNEEQVKALRAEHEKAIELERTKASDLQKALDAKSAEHVKAAADFAKANGDLTISKASEETLKKSVADLSDKLTERDVDALVGKKIVPAQKDAMLALAKSDRKAFDALVEATPVLTITEKKIPDADPRPPSNTSAKSASDELVAMIDASLTA